MLIKQSDADYDTAWEDRILLGNANPTPDIGMTQDNPPDGYHRDYLADKLLAYCRVHSDTAPGGQPGQLRIRRVYGRDIFEIYLDDEYDVPGWQPLVTGQYLRHRTEADGSMGRLQQRIFGKRWWINVDGGWSDHLGLNGSPLVRHYRACMGAYPPSMDSWTWGF